MKIAIIILNWNGQELLKQFLPSIVKFSSQEASIYIIDNASTDSSVDYIKEFFPIIKIIKHEENLGYAKGYNNSLKKIESDIYCLLNSDVEVSKGWLSPVISAFKEDKNTAIVQPKILDYNNKLEFEYAGAAGGFIDFFGYPYCRGRLFNYLEKDRGQFNDTKDVFWASGACFFIKSKTYHRLGGLDEDYYAHQEEIDLCWRTQNIGYKVKYVGSSSVYHVGGATLKENNSQKTYLNFRNSLLNIVKNMPKNRVLIVVFCRLTLDYIAGLKFILELRPIHTFAILKAHISFYLNLYKFLNKRKIAYEKKNYNIHTSVVWQYFILGRKTFSKLK